MTFGSVIMTILVGVVIGALGRLVVRGPQRMSWILTILVGIAAAFMGTWLAALLGVNDTRGVDWIELFLQIGVAAVLVALVARYTAKPRPVSSAPPTSSPPAV